MDNRMKPRMPRELEKVDSIDYLHDLKEQEITVYGISMNDVDAKSEDFYKIEISSSIFEKCVFSGASFERASFKDVVFKSCDLSNAIFSEAYFERCTFISCKCIGMDLSGAIIKNVGLENCNLQYSNFNESSITSSCFEHVEFIEASMTNAKQKGLEIHESRVIKCNFYGTKLWGIDFTGNEFYAPIVSDPPRELKGITVDMFQAAELIGIIGIKVKK